MNETHGCHCAGMCDHPLRCARPECARAFHAASDEPLVIDSLEFVDLLADVEARLRKDSSKT